MLNHFIFACLFCCGLVLIYRGTLKDENLITLRGKIIEKKVEVVSKYGSGSKKFALTFTIESNNNKFGIFTGPDSLTEKNSLIRSIELNEFYKIYVDPTVVSRNGINLGVRKIERSNIVVYEKDSASQFYLGIIVSTLILIFWCFYAIRK